MQKNVPTKSTEGNGRQSGQATTLDNAKFARHTASLPRLNSLMPAILTLAMITAILFLDAVLPLSGFWFPTSLLSQLGSWPLLPTHILFPGRAVSSSITSAKPSQPDVLLSWQQVPILLLAFLIIFLLYLLALRLLPSIIDHNKRRFILLSTLFFGAFYILFPVMTSPDIFSYISYARMGVLYHLNPLTTLPTTISVDPSYVYIYWNTQPSAYGPTWAAISSALQWLTLIFGAQTLLPIVLALRLFGLAMHLCSTLLIWSIVDRLQRIQGQISTYKRTLATLSFAWNPLLLLEACVNAHNDAPLLLLVLLAIWFLLPPISATPAPTQDTAPTNIQMLLGILMLALATCLKLNIVLLMPFVLIFIWKQTGIRSGIRSSTVMGLVYAIVIILLYAPFWQGGAILNIFHTNPTTSRDINTLVEFLSRLYNSVITNLGFPQPPENSSPSEAFTHTLSISLFIAIYIWSCWRAIRTPDLNALSSLIRWLAVIWLLYCFIGTPWFWPWYLVTFFGLYALIEGTTADQAWRIGPLRLHLAVPLLVFSMLSLYCFFAWGVYDSFLPGLPDFRWAYLGGLWAWLIPLLAAYSPPGFFRNFKPYPN